MAVVIDGTTGITAPANTVLGNLSYTGTLTGNGGIINLGSGQVYKDASGNVGIGTSSPAAKLDVFGTAKVYTGGPNSSYPASVLAVRQGSSDTTNIGLLVQGGVGSTSKDIVSIGYDNAGTHVGLVRVNNSAELICTNNLLVGTTSGTAPGRVSITTATDGNGLGINGIKSVNSNYYFINFRANGSGVGDIYSNGSTTTYATTSDYRLKENVQPMVGALAKVAALKPCTYTWTNTGLAGQGFLAHELQAVEPDCVGGEKDAVDAEGNPQYQGIDTSFLVATLAAAIQEQQTLITALTARITALEAPIV